jgi:quercetin dioxygenase-like cupin family protein
MSTSAYDDTSGTAFRGARPLMERLMVFSVADEVAALREEPQYRDGDRTSRMLAKDVDLRVMLTVLRTGAALDEQDGDSRVTVQLVEGQVAVELGGESAELGPGDVAVIDAGNPWLVRAIADSALVLTIVWPREKVDTGS